MDTLISQVKSHFINELWLPLSFDLGKMKSPRIRKNKNFRFFTLTTGFDYTEIEKFVKSNISKYDGTVAWTNNSTKKYRIETGVRVKVFNQAKYEDINLEHHQVSSYFPFDIINLDFLSQDDWNSPNKLLKVIKSYGETIKCQDTNDSTSFLIILTVPIDEQPILRDQFEILRDFPGVITRCSSFPPSIKNMDEKVSFLETLLVEMISEFGFEIINCKTNSTQQPLSAMSIAIIAKVRENS